MTYPTSPADRCLADAHRRREEAELLDVEHRSLRHGLHLLARVERAVDDAHERHDPAVLVVRRVEDERAGGRVGLAARRRDAVDDGLEDVGDAGARLRRDADDVVGRAADQVGDLRRHAVGVGRGQVDLVHDRHDLELVLDREVGVGKRLGLDALGRVDHEDRALARGQAAAHLVAEVDMAGRVDQVQLVGPLVGRPEEHPHRLGLDRDASLALEIHGVEELVAHLAHGDRLGHLEDAIGQRRLPVIDVGDDREVADP